VAIGLLDRLFFVKHFLQRIVHHTFTRNCTLAHTLCLDNHEAPVLLLALLLLPLRAGVLTRQLFLCPQEQPQAHPAHHQCPRKRKRNPAGPVCLPRWLPRPVPSPSALPSATDSRQCCLAAAALALQSSNNRHPRPNNRLTDKVSVANRKPKSSQSVLRRLIYQVALGILTSSKHARLLLHRTRC